MKEKQQGLLAVLTATTIFGLNIPVTKALMDAWMTPMGYTIVRMFFGVLIFWFIGLFLSKEKVDKKDFPIIFIGGLMDLLEHNFCFPKLCNIHHQSLFLC